MMYDKPIPLFPERRMILVHKRFKRTILGWLRRCRTGYSVTQNIDEATTFLPEEVRGATDQAREQDPNWAFKIHRVRWELIDKETLREEFE